MAHKVIDRCKETTSTTGTGTLTLTGPVAGFVAMADAATGLTTNGDTSWFVAEIGSQWEEFLGTRVDATHLARTTVLKSSNGGALVNFTSPPVVFGTVPAERISAVGPSVSAYRSTTQQSITSSTWTKVELNAESFDTGNCFDSSTNYRWTPTVEGYYHVSFTVWLGAASGLTAVAGSIYKNGVDAAGGSYSPPANSTSGNSSGSKLIYMNGTTDYLELWAWGSGTSVNIGVGDRNTFMTAYLASLPGAPMLAPIVAPGPSFKADRTATDQTITSGAWEKVQLNGETFDNGNCFDSTTNYRFQPNVEGYYQMSMSVDLSAASAATGALASIYKNGAAALYGSYQTVPGGTEAICTGGGLIYMNGTTDYLELWGLIAGTTTKVKFGPATYMTGFLAALPQVPQPTSGPAFRAYRSADQTGVPNATFTKVALNTEEFDVGGCFDSTTNYRFTPNVAGYYFFEWTLTCSGSPLTSNTASLRKNGAEVANSVYYSAAAGSRIGGSRLIYMNGTTDYVELFGYVSGTTLKFASGLAETSLSGHFVRA